MSGRRRGARPADPIAIALRRAEARAREAKPETWGLDGGALRLPANQAVSLARDAAGRTVRARRQDVFDSLAGRGRLGPEALAAVRRLQADIASLHRTGLGCSDWRPKVDGGADPQQFVEAQLRAGRRLEAALSRSGAASARLLMALCEPEAALGQAAPWRDVVARIAGESLPDAQGALVRMACENLAAAYDALDRERRRERVAAAAGSGTG